MELESLNVSEIEKVLGNIEDHEVKYYTVGIMKTVTVSEGTLPAAGVACQTTHINLKNPNINLISRDIITTTTAAAVSSSTSSTSSSSPQLLYLLFLVPMMIVGVGLIYILRMHLKSTKRNVIKSEEVMSSRSHTDDEEICDGPGYKSIVNALNERLPSYKPSSFPGTSKILSRSMASLKRGHGTGEVQNNDSQFTRFRQSLSLNRYSDIFHSVNFLPSIKTQFRSRSTPSNSDTIRLPTYQHVLADNKAGSIASSRSESLIVEFPKPVALPKRFYSLSHKDPRKASNKRLLSSAPIKYNPLKLGPEQNYKAGTIPIESTSLTDNNTNVPKHNINTVSNNIRSHSRSITLTIGLDLSQENITTDSNCQEGSDLQNRTSKNNDYITILARKDRASPKWVRHAPPAPPHTYTVYPMSASLPIPSVSEVKGQHVNKKQDRNQTKMIQASPLRIAPKNKNLIKKPHPCLVISPPPYSQNIRNIPSINVEIANSNYNVRTNEASSNDERVTSNLSNSSYFSIGYHSPSERISQCLTPQSALSFDNNRPSVFLGRLYESYNRKSANPPSTYI